MFSKFTTKELIVLRDALKENNCQMRIRDGKVLRSHNQQLDRLAEDLNPVQYAAHPYVIASRLIAEVEAAIVSRGTHG
jgi:hypothetical protein